MNKFRDTALTLRGVLNLDDYVIPQTGNELEAARAESLFRKWADRRLLDQASSAISELEKHIEEEDPIGSTDVFNWSFSKLTIRREPLPVHIGFVQCTRHYQLLPPPSDAVVSLILKFPDYKDFLERENHNHFGWHYHYLDKKMRRSNVILCWDTKWCPERAFENRPIFWERHGEGRYQFAAHPNAWASAKRSSMHAKCSKDSEKRDLREFKQASKEAQAVWPTDARLTSEIRVGA